MKRPLKNKVILPLQINIILQSNVKKVVHIL